MAIEVIVGLILLGTLIGAVAAGIGFVIYLAKAFQ